MLASSLSRAAGGGGKRGRRLGETALTQERVGGRQPAAKRLVGFGRILRAAGGVNLFAQPLSGRRIENVPGLLERREGVGIEHLGPHVAVIGSRIAAAREDMAE